MRKPLLLVLVAVWAIALLTGCGGEIQDAAPSATQDPVPSVPEQSPQVETTHETNEKEPAEMKMNVQIGDYTFTATLEDNRAVDELVEMMEEGPVTLHLDDFSGFEKVGPLGRSLTTSNTQTTTQAGDIVLYNGNNIVRFYGSNSWSDTRLAKIDDLTGWADALGRDSVTATLTLTD